MNLDGPEERAAYFDELAARGATDSPEPRRRCVLIENPGYPLRTWLEVHFTADEQSTEITSIDVYADAEREHLLVDGIELRAFSLASQVDLAHALHGKLCAERDRAYLMREVDRIQAAMRC